MPPKSKTPYIDSIKPSFVCPKCLKRHPEKKGYLVREGLRGEPFMADRECIKEFQLIYEPEEKERMT